MTAKAKTKDDGSKASQSDNGMAPLPAAILAYGSLAPLAAALILILTDGLDVVDAADAVAGLVAYAALLLSFLAGARFGSALRVTGAPMAVLITAVPIAAAMASMLIPSKAAVALLAAGLAAQGAWDVWAAERARLPDWYGRLRLRTTPIAVLVLIVGFVVIDGGAS